MKENMTKGIIGAVIGDVVGSSKEFHNPKTRRFGLFPSGSTFTDDTVLTMAVAQWLLDGDAPTPERELLEWGRKYPYAGFGRGFRSFLYSGVKPETGSTHNGAAMRVSAVGFKAGSLDEAVEMARMSALPSHDTPDAVSGAQAVAAAIYMALHGASKDEIREYVESRFYINLSQGVDEARAEIQAFIAMKDADHDLAHEALMNCRNTVRWSLECFLGSEGYEQTVRNAVWIGSDTDTQACIAGAVAAAFWGVPENIVKESLVFLSPDIIDIVNRIDGTSWKPTGITPPHTKRWSPEDRLVCGSDASETFGGAGFSDTVRSQFCRHPNTPYYIHTVGESLGSIESQVAALLEKAAGEPQRRFLVRELGCREAGYTAEQIAPFFRKGLTMDNVLLPRSFVEILGQH